MSGCLYARVLVQPQLCVSSSNAYIRRRIASILAFEQLHPLCTDVFVLIFTRKWCCSCYECALPYYDRQTCRVVLPTFSSLMALLTLRLIRAVVKAVLCACFSDLRRNSSGEAAQLVRGRVGDSALVECIFQSLPRADITWFKDDQHLQMNNR